MTGEYILGYINGYEDGERGRRAPDHPRRSNYNAGYDCGHEDGRHDEDPDYTRDDPDNFRRLSLTSSLYAEEVKTKSETIKKIEEDRLSFFAI